MVRFPLPSQIKAFAQHFHNASKQLYIVGGAVRDYVMKRPSEDYDFATDATPQEMKNLFRTVIPTGIEHGTVTIIFQGEHYEVTTFRSEGKYLDGRRPQSVEFITSLEEDLSRRDFTMNALAVNAYDGTLIDLHQGLEDIKSRTIRAIGSPAERFGEDALRILRGCRFAALLDFTVEHETLLGMQQHVEKLHLISGERIRMELCKMLESSKPSVGLELMRISGALALILPELAACYQIPQGTRHQFDLYYHSLATCDLVHTNEITTRFAALYHDVGKRVTFQEIEGKVTFYHHEKISAQMALAVTQRLKFSNNEQKKIVNLIENHMFSYFEESSDGVVRRFINRVGLEALPELFALRRGDQEATDGSRDFRRLVALSERITRLLEESQALTVKDLAVTGNDLHELGIPKNEVMGEILAQLLETVLDDPQQNKREHLLQIARSLYQHYYERPNFS